MITLSEGINRTVTLPSRPIDDTKYIIKGGETIEIIYPKQEPWLDWQENTPENKPEEGVLVLIKTTVEYADGYSKYCIATKDNRNGCWNTACYKFSDQYISKWAYIPE